MSHLPELPPPEPTDWFRPAPAAGRRLLSTVGARRLAIVAQSGAGKTYAILRLLELLYEKGSPFVAVDPMGNFWGLRLASDGQRPGLDVFVLGGSHGDAELPASSGPAIAEFLARTKASLILDVSRLDEEERAEFVTSLTKRLLELWSEKRRVLTLVLDEAQEFIPETLESKLDGKMRAQLRRYALTGRNLGLGLVMLTQAPQNVQKRVFNLAELLLVGRLGGEHERAAVERWVRRKGVDGKALLADLPSLPSGTFYASSPEWLQLAEKVTVTERITFDASRTPELGDEAPDERALAHVELGPLLKALRDCLPAAASVVAGDDEPEPNSAGFEQQHVIDALERELGDLRRVLVEREHIINRLGERNRELERASLQAFASLREVMPESALAPSERALAADAFTAPGSLAGSFRVSATPLVDASLSRGRAELPRVLRTDEVLPIPTDAATRARRLAPRSEPPPALAQRRGATTAEGESKAKDRYRQDLLATICTYGPLNRERLSLLSGKSRTSTAFASGIRWLVAARLITDEDVAEGGTRERVMKATTEGHRQSPQPPLPLGRELLEHWRSKLSAYDARAFDALVKVPGGLTRQQLAERTGNSLTSTAFARSIRTMKAMGLAGEAERRIFLLHHVRTAMGLS